MEVSHERNGTWETHAEQKQQEREKGGEEGGEAVNGNGFVKEVTVLCQQSGGLIN